MDGLSSASEDDGPIRHPRRHLFGYTKMKLSYQNIKLKVCEKWKDTWRGLDDVVVSVAELFSTSVEDGPVQSSPIAHLPGDTSLAMQEDNKL